jgi:hypothetical protein
LSSGVQESPRVPDSAFHAGAPKMLFKLPGPLSGNLGNVRGDGQQFVFAINVSAD